MKLLAMSFLTLALSFQAIAAETSICLITTDIDSEQTDMLIETNSDGGIDSLRLYKTMNGKVISDETFPAEKVVEQGIVAAEREGRDVVILKTKNFNLVSGGIIVTDYLFNGIKNIRKTFHLKLNMVGGKYELTTMAGAKVNRLKFIANRAPVINKVIGIKEVRTSYSKRR